jgi:acetyl esterase/lipase
MASLSAPFWSERDGASTLGNPPAVNAQAALVNSGHQVRSGPVAIIIGHQILPPWDWSTDSWLENGTLSVLATARVHGPGRGVLHNDSTGESASSRATMTGVQVLDADIGRTLLSQEPTRLPYSAQVTGPTTSASWSTFTGGSANTSEVAPQMAANSQGSHASAGGELSFADPIDYAAGRSPQSVATGHFHDRHILDLAVANFDSNDVSIFLGRGDGTFRLAETIVVGNRPSFITTGHFHDPDILDLAVANSGSNDVSILLGHGDGSFGLPHSFAVGRGPLSIAVDDFRGNGMQDLAVANQGSNDVSILPGNGDGTFAAPTTIGLGRSPTFVAAGEFDGDGFPDLAVSTLGVPATLPGTLSILLGNGDGTFRSGRSYQVGVPPASIAVSDFNRDGSTDLAVANSFSTNVSVLLGNGDGTFAPAHNYQVGDAQSLAVGDFNGDGVPDLVTADFFGSISVLLGNGDGTFQPVRDYWAGAHPRSVAVGDFNGDGRDDLAVLNLYTNQLSILLNNSPQPGDGVRVVRDIVYYDGPYSNPERQSLDVYLPPVTTDFPVVFLVHGGGYSQDNKGLLGYFARSLAREGIGVVAITYRLTDGSPQQVVHPGHEVDLARAFAWTYDHIAAYGGNPNKIVVAGWSSGSQMVALLATDPRYLAAQGLSPDLISGAIGVSGGGYDMRPASDFAFAFGDEEQRWEASALRYVSEHQPPFQLLVGANDTAARQMQAQTFYDAIRGVNGEAELHVIPDRDHAGIIARAARPGDPARELMLRFIAEHTT